MYPFFNIIISIAKVQNNSYNLHITALKMKQKTELLTDKANKKKIKVIFLFLIFLPVLELETYFELRYIHQKRQERPQYLLPDQKYPTQ